MDFINFLIENLEVIPIGISVIGMGAIFWYMPFSKRMRTQQKLHLKTAEYYRTHGHEVSAVKIEAIYKNANIRFPIYGKILVGIGTAILIYGFQLAL